ncbi:hypothetical protein HMPREF1015_01961 [Bacillus smithii 7_3_47FAA]|uniref:Uncharacterized protein n=1 Tax=Bacillus smithii 7_3_47FAA TaxID=665952 RepID=G9QJS8_9BACI|nr:hypothetical protein HMPREF1015_01961 [Bacillus smithii 7_3_47FAA]
MLHQLTLILENTATELISTLGHWGIFIAMMIESMCIPRQTKSLCYLEDSWPLKALYTC